jgi:hypothetical protein
LLNVRRPPTPAGSVTASASPVSGFDEGEEVGVVLHHGEPRPAGVRTRASPDPARTCAGPVERRSAPSA